ncbi:MAG: hypothetical protein MK077_04625 [Phycisphaerales bacterium]|nr:hypothetical protein [Phycisphaerales bacterium]
MSTPFQCTVITPSGSAFEGQVRYASFPAWDGQYGVAAGMAPLLGKLGQGALHLDTSQGRRTMQIEGGFAHVRQGVLTLLTEHVQQD